METETERLKEEITKDIEEEKLSLGQLMDELNELESDIYDFEEKIRELEKELEETEKPQTKLDVIQKDSEVTDG